MSPENIPPQPENHAIDRKTTSQKQPPDQQPMKCPRCDSSNTKFCYYNNYSLTQPRHFCKTCRRYWTRGGALRNVPIGGGCRKTKKLRTSSSSTTSSKLLSAVSGGEFGATAFKFLDQNLNPGLTPATDFQLGGLSLPKLHPATAGVYTQFITSSGSTPLGCGPGTGAACFGLDLMGLNNYPASSTPSLVQVTATGNENHQQQHISISSIESLSSMNQEMHWKLQQQRLAMIYGPSPQNDQNVDNQDKSTNGEINLFKNLEINNNKNNSTSNGDHNSTRKIDVGPTEWLFDQINTTSSPATNYGGNNNVNEASGSTLHGVWGDLQHQHQHHHHHQQLHQFNGLQ